MKDEARNQVADAARELTEIDDDLYDIHGEPVAELPSMTVYADSHGSEHREIAEHHNDRHGTDLTPADVGAWMHDQVKGIDHSWSADDPVVVLHD